MRFAPDPRTRPQRPSPLAQVQHARKLSAQLLSHFRDPPVQTVGLVQDPYFWKRFSVAVHAIEDEEKRAASSASTSSSISLQLKRSDTDDWLARQREKKRRCKCIGWAILLAVSVVISTATVLLWYFLVARKS